MALIEFVRHHEDRSTDLGFQFKFFCDKCNSGYMSEFQKSATGMAGGALRVAGSFLGGIFGQAASSEYEVRRLTQGPAHDAALKKAVEQVKEKFRKCSRCGQWVCIETCWNETKGQCETCAPDLMEEAAAQQAQAAKEQIYDKARKIDQIKDVDLVSNVKVRCPACQAQVKGGKFCPECGAPLESKIQCKKCGTEMAAGAKFCPECGLKMA